MKHRLDMRLRQMPFLTPRLLLEQKLIQIPTLELQQALHQEILTNPVLELEEEDPIVESPTAESGDEQPSLPSEEECALSEKSEPEPEEPDWPELPSDEYDSSYSPREHEELEFQEKVPVAGATMQESVLAELRLLVHGEEEEDLAEYIVGMLDDRGYLQASDEEIASETKSDIAAVRAVVEKLQGCNPPGIGARSLRECLLLQIKAREMEGNLAWRIVDEQFENLAKRRHAEMARDLKTGLDKIQEAIDLIATLKPHPGRLVSSDDARYIYPDVIVDESNGQYEVFLNERGTPRLRVSRAYADMARRQEDCDPEVRRYIRGQITSARLLMRAIDMRRHMVVRVMEAIVEEQRAFFEGGISHLRPLTLKQIGERVHRAECTVARVTKDKYVQTPRGTYPMKFFFSSGLQTEDGTDASAKSVRQRIREMIEAEPKDAPLSDEKIAKLLQGERVHIARRTVAKYRDQMKIDKAQYRRRAVPSTANETVAGSIEHHSDSGAGS